MKEIENFMYSSNVLVGRIALATLPHICLEGLIETINP